MTPHKIPEVITEEEFIRLIRKVRKPHHKIAFILGFYGAMRVSEIAGKKETISRCCKAKIREEKYISDKKTRRTNYFCSECNNKLSLKDMVEGKEWAVPPLNQDNIDRGQRIIRIKQAKGKRDRNIPLPPQTQRGLSHIPIKCGVRALEIAFKKYGKKVLDKDLHFHQLRHSGATHYLNKKKWSTRQVQQLLGHSKIQTTEIYTHVTPEVLIEKMWGEG